MNKINRYLHRDFQGHCVFEECTKGEWVKYSDHEAVVKQLKKLLAEANKGARINAKTNELLAADLNKVSKDLINTREILSDYKANYDNRM